MRRKLAGLFGTVFVVISFIVLLISKPALADDTTDSSSNGGFSEAIEDNSIIIEEAYNQEDRVVQHISNFNYFVKPKDFQYIFTQEWPIFGLKHQFSYQISYETLAERTIKGFGDLQLNYRYQLTYKNDWAVVAPRLSVVLPTGNKDKGLGMGAFGLETNIPVSKRWSDLFITHINAGARLYPSYKQDDIKFNGSLVNYWAGISGILLLSENFNLMLECLDMFTANPGLDNKVSYSRDLYIAPAVRFAIDIGDLQIVPAVSLPFRFSSETPVVYGDAYFYLSFEHPF